jgi:predicted AAA+ superfamily ATPase
MKRVKLRFTPKLEVEFADRDRGIRHVYELAEKGTRFPVVVFGPEGCGKTAWLRQAVEVLKEQGFDSIYIDVLSKEHIAYTDVKEVVDRISDVVADVTGYSPIKLADLAILLANKLLKRWRKKKIALLIDEVFQAIGLDRAEAYVKMLLNLIEHPPESYENIVIIVATSEGLSRWRIGRHRWAEITPMWNMSERGFEELYEKIPGPKPSFEEIWRLAGGNPSVFSQLYQANWDVDSVLDKLAKSESLSRDFISMWRSCLKLALEDVDAISNADYPQELRNELIERNLIVYDMYPRNPDLWVDELPLEKDPELGIGKYVAWQTPLHREAVKKALQSL